MKLINRLVILFGFLAIVLFPCYNVVLYCLRGLLQVELLCFNWFGCNPLLKTSLSIINHLFGVKIFKIPFENDRFEFKSFEFSLLFKINEIPKPILKQNFLFLIHLTQT